MALNKFLDSTQCLDSGKMQMCKNMQKIRNVFLRAEKQSCYILRPKIEDWT